MINDFIIQNIDFSSGIPLDIFYKLPLNSDPHCKLITYCSKEEERLRFILCCLIAHPYKMSLIPLEVENLIISI